MVSYRIFVRKTIDGNEVGESKTFSKTELAQQWHDKRVKELEYESIHGKASDDLIGEIITRYQDQYANSYGRFKYYDIARLLRYPIAQIQCSKLSPKHMIAHCEERNKSAKPQAVLNDVIWLRIILRTMSATEGFDYHPGIFERAMVVLKQERLVAKSASRDRLQRWVELLKLTRHFKKLRTKTPMVEIMWFAYFSSRRLSEITRLEWVDNNDIRQTGIVEAEQGDQERAEYGEHLIQRLADDLAARFGRSFG